MKARERPLKKFTHEQIQIKLSERKDVPNYYDVLMECSVKEDADGVYFDLHHPSWKKLVQMVREHDSKNKRQPESAKTKPRSKSSAKEDTGPTSFPANSDPRKILDEALASTRPNRKVVRECCKQIGKINPNERQLIWKILLNVEAKRVDFQPLPTVVEPLFNQRVITADIERTRPTIETFQNPEVREKMELILTEYCRRNSVSYKQGMNYVLAPFFMIGISDIETLYLSFESMVETFQANIFSDDEFGGLQCIFRLFRLLLQYHDPELFLFLHRNDMTPELYASSWFMTLHTQKCDVETLIYVWDELLLETDSRFHYFLSLELLRHHRADIISSSFEEIPEYLSNIKLPNIDVSRRLINEARKTYSKSPLSFRDLLRNVTKHKIKVDSPLYHEIEQFSCLPLDPKELKNNVFHDKLQKKKRRRAQQFKFFVLDCRPHSQYHAGHLPLGMHLDPELNLDSPEYHSQLNDLTAMKGCHFVLFFDGCDSEHNRILMAHHLNRLLEKGVRYVSYCSRGYQGIHELVYESDGKKLELVDHNPSQCVVCSGKKGFLSKMKSQIDGMLAASEKARSRLNRRGAPARCRPLKQTTELILLHSILRDAETSPAKFRSATLRLCSLLIAESLELMPTEEVTVKTHSGTTFHGQHAERSIYGVALSTESESALKMSLEVFHPVAKTVVGMLKVEESFKQDKNGVLRTNRSAVAYVPKDIGSRIVLLFHPVLSKTELNTAIEALVRLGSMEKDIIVLCLIATRSALWSFSDKFPDARIIVSAVDSIDGAGHVVPGIGKFENRYVVP